MKFKLDLTLKKRKYQFPEIRWKLKSNEENHWAAAAPGEVLVNRVHIRRGLHPNKLTLSPTWTRPDACGGHRVENKINEDKPGTSAICKPRKVGRKRNKGTILSFISVAMCEKKKMIRLLSSAYTCSGQPQAMILIQKSVIGFQTPNMPDESKVKPTVRYTTTLNLDHYRLFPEKVSL